MPSHETSVALPFDGEPTIGLVVGRTVAALGEVLVQVLLPALEP